MQNTHQDIGFLSGVEFFVYRSVNFNDFVFFIYSTYQCFSTDSRTEHTEVELDDTSTSIAEESTPNIQVFTTDVHGSNRFFHQFVCYQESHNSLHEVAVRRHHLGNYMVRSQQEVSEYGIKEVSPFNGFPLFCQLKNTFIDFFEIRLTQLGNLISVYMRESRFESRTLLTSCQANSKTFNVIQQTTIHEIRYIDFVQGKAGIRYTTFIQDSFYSFYRILDNRINRITSELQLLTQGFDVLVIDLVQYDVEYFRASERERSIALVDDTAECLIEGLSIEFCFSRQNRIDNIVQRGTRFSTKFLIRQHGVFNHLIGQMEQFLIKHD